MAKSDAIASIVDQVQKNSPLGGFVKRDSRTGRWLRIKESEARDKVGHAIRKAIQRLEDTRPKTIERLKNRHAAIAVAQPAQHFASSSQQEGGTSSKRSDQIKGGEPSESDRSSKEPTLRRGDVPIDRKGDSKQRGNQSRPGSVYVLGLENAALQQRLLPPPHLDLLNHSSRLASPGGGGDPLSRTNMMSRNFPLSASQQLAVAQRLLAQQNHHALPGIPSPYEQSLVFGHSLNGSSGQQHSSPLGRSMRVGSESVKQAQQDSLIIKVLQEQQREQESRRIKQLECARRLILEGGLLPGLTGGVQQTGGQRQQHHQGSTSNIPMMPSLNATLQHQSGSRAKQETSQTHHSEHALLLRLLASSQQNKGVSRN
jgi:hypothetical protein